MASFSSLYTTVLNRFKAVEPTADFHVDYYELSLDPEEYNATTGQYVPQYAEAASIEAIIATKAAAQTLLGTGVIVRLDATALTLTAVVEGSKIVTATGLTYRIESVKPYPFADLTVTYEAALTYLPMEETPA